MSARQLIWSAAFYFPSIDSRFLFFTEKIQTASSSCKLLDLHWLRARSISALVNEVSSDRLMNRCSGLCILAQGP